MKDSELQFDRTCHVLYSKPCKRQIREKIALHYPEGECETVWERVQRQYVTFLRDWRTGRSSRRRRPATSGAPCPFHGSKRCYFIFISIFCVSCTGVSMG